MTYVDSDWRISPEKRLLSARSEPFRDELSLGGARGVIRQFCGCDPFAGGVKRRAKGATALRGLEAGERDGVAGDAVLYGEQFRTRFHFNSQ